MAKITNISTPALLDVGCSYDPIKDWFRRTVRATITAVCLAGTNTRRVKRALAGQFESAVGKDAINSARRKVKVDCDASCARSLAEKTSSGSFSTATRRDRKTANISVLVADYRDMIDAESVTEAEIHPNTSMRKLRLNCRAGARDSRGKESASSPSLCVQSRHLLNRIYEESIWL
jgi:hypothetical protein